MSRPKGSRNILTFAWQHPSRCHMAGCGSTKRTGYQNRTVEECQTTVGNRLPVTHLVKQSTTCGHCGAPRIDCTYHFVPDGGPLDEAAEANPLIAAEIEELAAEVLKRADAERIAALDAADEAAAAGVAPESTPKKKRAPRKKAVTTTPPETAA